MSFVNPDKQFAPRQIVADLKRFLHSKDNAGPGSFTISDCGYLLLMLKDQILRDVTKHFATEIVNPPLYGLDVLSRVIIALQGVINSSADFASNTEISQMSTRKRKAAIAEADCIEIIKLLLEKTERGWAYFLDSSTGMDAILFSVYSPQLDSKCFSLEILLLLLKQQKGFTVLMRALTAMAARTREYLRLGIFVNQLKHGIHTHKLHIQVLVVRLLNKFLAAAPDALHASLIKVEASLAHFSPKNLEMMLSKHNAMLDGYDVLVEELDVWRTLNGAEWELRKPDHNTENPFFTKQRSTSNLPMGFSTFSRNLDQSKGNRTTSMNNQIKSQTLAKVNRTMLSPKKDNDEVKKSGRPYKSNLRDSLSDSYDDHSYGGMRRAKSESSMLNAERTAEQMQPFVRRLKRNDVKKTEQVPLSRNYRDDRYTGSVHDLSIKERQMTTERPVSALNQPYRYPASSRPSYANDLVETRLLSTRERERPTSSQARFMDPPVFETQKPHAGFSYLFPQQPLVSNLTLKKSTPRDIGNIKPNWLPAQMAVPTSYYNGNSQSKQHPILVETSNDNPHYYTVEQETIENDVLDALSQFDYLNDYDNKKDYYD